MFCPRCSQPQPSDDLRFCPRCGFPLGSVQELVLREGAGGGERPPLEGGSLPAQKDVAAGALMMFAGCVVAVLWGFMGTRGPAEVLLPQAYFIMGGTLAFLLTLLHPLLRSLEGLASGVTPHTRRRRDGIDLGAILMFVGALKAALLTSLMPAGPERGATTLLLMAGMLLLILLLRPILHGARALFYGGRGGADSTAGPTTARLGGSDQGAALPPAQGTPVNGVAAARPNSAEPAAPPSVTEETTRKLDF